ncbi:MAG TPA: SGNH/GDSL hydrolase family protein [Terriglobales bacterium]|nr:SGNH/GDSL hydrolase family protein [Terriglobales bacterium]
MTPFNAGNPEDCQEKKLPPRDWILLPLISLLTIGLLAGSTELIARRMFSRTGTLYDCLVLNDPSTGTRGIPGCVSREKIEETQPVEYRFNSSGYRAETEFGPKSPGTYRIVMVGSSFAMGYRVPVEETFAARLQAELSQRTGLRTELFNEAMAGSGGSPRSVSLRFKDALAAKPDLILWILTFWDVSHVSSIMPEETPAGHETSIGRTRRLVKEALARKSIVEMVRDLSDVPLKVVRVRWEMTRTAFLLQHFLNESQSQYLRAYLIGSDSNNGFLKTEPSAEWQTWLRQSDSYAEELQARAAAAGVPLVAVLVPDRAQAALISMGAWPADIDPFKLDDELRAMIVRHGGIYIDILSGFRNIPNPEHYYFPVDGHPNAEGQRIISRLLAEALTGGAIPALKVAAQSPAAKDPDR